MRLLLALSILLLAAIPAYCDVIVNTPLRSQLPQIAHLGLPYNWTLSVDTFGFISPSGQAATSPPLTYTATGLPGWVQFDAASLTFSGNPSSGGVGSDRVTVTATLSDVTQAMGGTTSASTSFTLMLINEVYPTLSVPISKQLGGVSSSLGPKNILPDNTLHVPSGWSFSLGFDGSTFTLPNYATVYTTLLVNGSTTIPPWLTWSADTFTLYGVAPNTGNYLYNFNLVGSNRPGYGGTSDTFRILVSAEALSIENGLRAVNTSAGNAFTYQIPTTGLELNGKQNDVNSNPVSVTANVTAFPWMSFDSSTSTLTGTPPIDQFQNISTTAAELIPVTFSDKSGNVLTVSLTVNVVPSAFALQTLPNLILSPGAIVNVSLGQYIRSGVNSIVTRQVSISNSSSPQVIATFDPTNATSFLSYDDSTRYLTGKMPESNDTRVKVDLQGRNSLNQTSTASFYIANTANGLPSTTNGTFKHGSGSHGLSHRAKVALIAALAGVVGLLLLIMLMICCRRYVAKEEHSHRGAVYGDETTFSDKGSIRPHYKKALVIRTAGEAMTPSTLAASPFGDYEKQLTPVSPYTIKSVVIEDPNGEKRTVEEPMQSRMMNNLFITSSKGKRKSVPPLNAGLGLEGVDDNPYADANEEKVHASSSNSSGNAKMIPSQSQKTTGTHRSSWESDLFYEDVDENKKGLRLLTVQDEIAEDVPRRRAGGLTVRQRPTHNGQSPNFQAIGSFTPPEKGGQNIDAFQDSHTGLTPAVEEARILEAKVMQVRRHSPMMHSNTNPHSQAEARSVEAKRHSEAFDDALEDFEGLDMMGQVPRMQNTHRNGTNRAPYDRTSILSNMTDNSQMQAIRSHYANEEAAAVKSPNPSFMDGASLSGYEPQETVRAIQPRPRTPPAYSSQSNSPTKVAAAAAAQTSMGSSRFLPCPNVPAIVNYPVRFHIFPSVPPPMAGTPGSPGKRSGDVMKYSLVIDDMRPHLSPYRMTWPDMLGDWLTFNDATFEAFGIVPDEAGLEDLGDVEIALISTKKASSKVPPSPTSIARYDSPTKRSRHNKRGSTVSIDSSKSIVNEEDITIVARARLCFQAGPQAI